MADQRDLRDVSNHVSELPDVVLRYADHRDGLIEVFLPATLGRPAQPAPLLALVHGGFWRQEWDRSHLRPLASFLAQQGIAVALPEYRRVGGTAGLGGWPSTGQDVEAALIALPVSLDDVAPGRIDPVAPFVVAGHSAGGHLAMWAGLRLGASRVRRIVALAPVANLAFAAREGLDDHATQAFLGGEPGDVPERYADADPLQLLGSGVPLTVIQGTADLQVPVAANREVARQYPDLDYVELAGVDHYQLIDPLDPVFTSVVRPALGLL